jgi:hypothetical protein
VPPPSFDNEMAHHWFAVECNNAAWELVEQAEPSDEDRKVDEVESSFFPA